MMGLRHGQSTDKSCSGKKNTFFHILFWTETQPAGISTKKNLPPKGRRPEVGFGKQLM